MTNHSQFCALSEAIHSSASPACLPSISFIPTLFASTCHQFWIYLSSISFHVPFFFFSTIYFYLFQPLAYSPHPTAVLLSVYLSCPPSLLLLLSYPLLLPHPSFFCSVAWDQFLPVILAGSWPIAPIILKPSPLSNPFLFRYWMYLSCPKARKIPRHFRYSLPETLAILLYP